MDRLLQACLSYVVLFPVNSFSPSVRVRNHAKHRACGASEMRDKLSRRAQMLVVAWARLHPGPRHATDAAVTVVCDRVEEVLAQVKVAFLATSATIDNLGLVLGPVGTSDGDISAAERVVVRVGLIVI